MELFAGAGGLALGTSSAGFMHDAVIELDAQTCRTIRANQALGIKSVRDWPLSECDICAFDYTSTSPDIDLVAGGPPCQPFSLGGKHKGHLDQRNLFPEAVRAVRELRPKAFIFENVKGLLRENFATYFSYIQLQLIHPDIQRRNEEDWTGHLERLEKHETSRSTDGLNYNVVFRLVNAADYGVPQRRERVIIVGFRSDINAKWAFPEVTHSSDSLVWSKWVTGDYWQRHCHQPDNEIEELDRFRDKIDRMKAGIIEPSEHPWRTVRDAICDLPDPQHSHALPINNHQFVSGARSYSGHTGSLIDDPAKTLKAGDHGVPGGENTLVLPDGTVRYFTLREAARLQTFPDEYVFPVSWTESMRQLGNAVPVRLGYVIAKSVHSSLARSVAATQP